MTDTGSGLPVAGRDNGRTPAAADGLRSGLSGQYPDKSGGKICVTAPGIQSAGEHELDDDRIIVKGSMGNMVFLINEDDTLIGPPGWCPESVKSADDRTGLYGSIENSAATALEG